MRIAVAVAVAGLRSLVGLSTGSFSDMLLFIKINGTIEHHFPVQ
jgi:hypothetical protein